VIVAGSSIFNGDPAAAIRQMRDAVQAAQPIRPSDVKMPMAGAAVAEASVVEAKMSEGPVAAGTRVRRLSAADSLKREAGYRAVDEHVRSGMAVGLGTGSTAAFAVERLGQKLASGELTDVIAVPTSIRTKEHAEGLGIPLTTLDEQARLDVAIDGADAVDPQLRLLKGGGGAMLRERMVALRADKFVAVVDQSKLTDALGPSFPLPVEITPFCAQCTIRAIAALPALAGCEPRLRLGSAANNTVDGDEVVDLTFSHPIDDPNAAAKELKALTGVVDHGFFCGMATEAIIAGYAGVYAVHALQPKPEGKKRNLRRVGAALFSTPSASMEAALSAGAALRAGNQTINQLIRAGAASRVGRLRHGARQGRSFVTV